jgi:periplasmic divalent cation tolerance protein
MPYVVVLVTAPARAAGRLAGGLVRSRLAACVNVLPAVTSYYRWEGKLRRGKEALLIAKTRASKFKALERWIAERHPYDVPEVVSLKITGGSKAYLSFLAEGT